MLKNSRDDTGTLFINNLVGNTNDHEYLISSNSTLNLVKTRFMGDAVRAAGTETNTVNIINSSIIDVVGDKLLVLMTQTSR